MKKLSVRSLNILRNIAATENKERGCPGAVVKKSQTRIAARLQEAGYIEEWMTPRGYRLFTTSKTDDLDKT